MNIKIFKVNQEPLVKELKRIADCLEALLNFEFGIYLKPPIADESGEVVEVDYRNEARDAIAEYYAKINHKEEEDSEEE